MAKNHGQITVMGDVAGKTRDELIEIVRKQIGAGPNDTFEIVTPQFDRDATEPAPMMAPETLDEWNALRTMTAPELLERGLRRWGEEPEGHPNARMVWVFPHEWFDSVPEGFEVVNITGDVFPFRRSTGDDDKRFGCLSFGIFGPN